MVRIAMQIRISSSVNAARSGGRVSGIEIWRRGLILMSETGAVARKVAEQIRRMLCGVTDWGFWVKWQTGFHTRPRQAGKTGGVGGWLRDWNDLFLMSVTCDASDGCGG